MWNLAGITSNTFQCVVTFLLFGNCSHSLPLYFNCSYLLPDKGRSSKQKTAVIRRSCNPAWNHTFVYSDVSLQELSERALELTVWDHDRIASNEFLGGMRFNLGTGKYSFSPIFNFILYTTETCA